MLNLTSADWMDTSANQPAPNGADECGSQVLLHVAVAPVSVYVASPDINGGIAQSPDFRHRHPTVEAIRDRMWSPVTSQCRRSIIGTVRRMGQLLGEC